MFWITDSTTGSVLSDLLFTTMQTKRQQELRDIAAATADPLQQRQKKKVPAIISRFPFAIQGYQIRCRQVLVTLSFKS